MYYKTLQGDTWDIVAKKVYGSEIYADILMANNFSLLDIFIFSAGEKIFIPEISVQNSNPPPWRQ